MKQFFKNLFQAKKASYLLLAHDEKISIKENILINVILSPKYYWSKKLPLSVKYAHQAKSYAPSCFEGNIPEGNYTYMAQKDGDEFILYAYDDNYIIENLQKIGIQTQQISKVYFAQNEFKNLTTPISLSQNEALINHNGLLIQVPKQMTKECMGVDGYFKTHKLSNFFINLNKFNQIIEFKKAYIITALLSILAIFYMVEFFYLGSASEEMEQKRQNISKLYKLPSTSMQTKLFIKKFEKKSHTQISLREQFYKLTKLPLKKNQSIKSIEFNRGIFKIAVTNSTQNIKRYLQKYFKLQNVSTKGDVTIFEVKHDKKD